MRASTVGRHRHHRADGDRRRARAGPASERRCAQLRTASAASAPPIRPPRWPPIEMLAREQERDHEVDAGSSGRARTASGRSRARAGITTPRPSARRPRPRRRRCTASGPRAGSRRTSPPAARRSRCATKRTCPSAGSSILPEPVQHVHVEADVEEAGVQEPAGDQPAVRRRCSAADRSPSSDEPAVQHEVDVRRSRCCAAPKNISDVDRDQHVGQPSGRRASCASCAPACARASTPGSACRPGSASCSPGRSACRSSSRRRRSRGRVAVAGGHRRRRR